MPVRLRPDIERLLLAAQDARQKGDDRSAGTICRRILAGWPDVAGAINLLGLIRQAQGQREQAVRLFRRAIRLDDANASHHNNLGMVLRDLKRHDEAEAACRAALLRRGDFAKAWLNLGNVHFARGDHALARAHYREAIRHQHDYAKAWFNLARAERELGEMERAMRAVRRSLALQPSIDALSLLVALVDDLPSWAEALDAIEVAMARGLEGTPVRLLKGRALATLSRFEEARAIFADVVAADPECAEGWLCLGEAMDVLNRLEEAEQALGTAIRLRERGGAPDLDRQTRLRRSYVLLKRGHYEEGWAAHDQRWDHDVKRKRLGGTNAREWRGEPLEGKHLLVGTEAGLGDGIQFVRFLAEVRRLHRPARITLYSDRALAGLFKGVEGVDDLFVEGATTPDADVFCTLMDLPLRCGTTIPTIPARVPYLRLAPAAVREWRERVAGVTGSGPAVGIAWQGGGLTAFRHHRDVPLAALAPLFAVPGIRWINLQKGDGSEQMGGFAHPLVDFINGDPQHRLEDSAALVQALDLVITPDTMLAHLAGALARPAWVMLSSRGEWRWLTGREDSPWYPTLRLFRQRSAGQWGDVVRRMAEELALWAASHAASAPAASFRPGRGSP